MAIVKSRLIKELKKSFPNFYVSDLNKLVEIMEFYNIDIQNIYVIHDEIDLDCGQVKIKNGGGHNGHNGLKSIDLSIGKGYNRVRIGVCFYRTRNYYCFTIFILSLTYI